jgi:hypothetical protein|tara:strand:- start:331 stop:699 length:369 start_codon:yes stop_codon:yes gene_type:complete
MKLFETLNEETFTLFAARSFYNPTCIDAEEFYEDIKRFKYVKRLLNRYIDQGALAERLILNHLVVIFNVFTIPAGLKMLEYKLDEKHWSVVKPFLIKLSIIENNKYTGITMDQYVVDQLRKI